MSQRSLTKRAVIEPLESRRLLAAHAPLMLPGVLGLYDGNAAFSNGQTQTFTVFISKQHGGSFSGTSEDFIVPGATIKLTGTVNRRRVVHFNMKPSNATVAGQGTVDAAGTTITGSVRVRAGHHSVTGSFTLVEEPT